MTVSANCSTSQLTSRADHYRRINVDIDIDIIDPIRYSPTDPIMSIHAVKRAQSHLAWDNRSALPH